MEIKKCPKCNHIHHAIEPHACPSQEYIEARNRLVAEAAQGDSGEEYEHLWLDIGGEG